MNDLTEEERRLIRHALGLSDGSPMSYRNRYFADPDSPAYPILNSLLERGMLWVERSKVSGLDCFHVHEHAGQLVLEDGERLDPQDFRGRPRA